MNYRNYTMDEMVSVLTNEPDRSRFIEATKAFIEKFVDGHWVTDDELRQIKEDAMDERVDKMQEHCQNEAVQILEDSMLDICNGLTGQDWKILINSMKMLG